MLFFRVIFSTFFLLVCINTFAQFTDDFSDGDFTANPIWTGDDTVFTVINSGGNNLLRSNKQIASTSFYLSTPSTQVNDCQWEFYLNLQFNTSSANYVDIFLTSDQANLLAPGINGYFVRVGNTQDDICLYKRVSGVNTKIIDGLDGVTNFSNNILKIKITRTLANVWELHRDITGTGANYFLEGTVTDASVLTSNSFGIFITQSTNSFFNKHFFDDFYVGPIIYDLTPPAIVSATPVSATELDVLFDENVELITSETSLNYSVNNGIGTPISAIRDGLNFKLVHLTFANSFISNSPYTLTVNNVEDYSNNVVTNATANFIYYLLSTASYRDVVINEILADPDPQVGLPNKEFIEIYNPGNKYFQLSGWKFSDGSSTDILSNYILKPNDFLILCKSSDTIYYKFFGPVMGLNTWPALNNTGDNITLQSNTNTLIDALSYSDTWYGDAGKKSGGWTLEQINPETPCTGLNNWKASNDPNGGTPAAQNSLYNNNPDTTKPNLISVLMNTNFQADFFFDKSMDSLSLANATYALNNGITVTLVQPIAPDFMGVRLDFFPTLDSATAYTLTITNASDCPGNPLNNNTLLFGIGVKPQPFEIVINEIFANPSNPISLPEYEFVELYNSTGKVLLLDGLLFSDPISSTTIPKGVLLPNSYAILCPSSNQNLYNPYGYTLGLSSWPSLNNSGDNLSLKNALNQILSNVNYSDAWYKNELKINGGWTLEMIDPNNPCGEGENWAASIHSSGGTPGKINSIFGNNPDTEGPKLLKANALNDSTVLLTFNEIIDSVSAVFASYSIDNGITIASKKIDRKTIVLNLLNKLQIQTTYTVLVSGLTDCIGNSIGTQNKAQFALPEQANPLDVVINEVLFNPRTGGSDFVEVYNHSQKNINLQNWKLANYDNQTFSNLKTISDTPYLLKPGEYLVLTKDTINITVEYPNTKPGRFIQMSSLPSYNNSEGTVILINNIDEVCDRFDYTEKMHFPLLKDKKGITLERIDFNRPTNDVTNWHSAAESAGFATPGFENSQFQAGEGTDEMSLEPEIFSPDNDGYNDVLNIHYDFGEPGFVGSIFIYDNEGRIFRKLIQNELLASKGTISWDGIGDHYEKARIGIYIVYVEVYNLSGAVRHYKKPCVVAGFIGK